MGFNLQQACQMLIVSPHVHFTLKVIPTSQCDVWPRKEQQLVLSGRPTGRNDMYRFILFVLGNGGPARPLAAMLVGLGLLPNAKKRCDAWDVLRSFRDGTLRPDAFYWRLETNARQQVHAVDSWCAHGVPASMRDPLFWIDAQRMLKS